MQQREQYKKLLKESIGLNWTIEHNQWMGMSSLSLSMYECMYI